MKKIVLLLIFCFATVAGGASMARADAPGPPSTFCRYVPERQDDFAWENDLVAFRAYGPAIAANHGTENSGVDCWCKRVSYPIINRWYAGDAKHISYHKDHGEGYDLYHVGSSRGCGGTALWQNGKMTTAGLYKTWKIISQTRDKSVFELTYDYPNAGQPIHEVKRITIEMGKQLFRNESTFTQNGKPVSVPVAVGITTHDSAAVPTFLPKQGVMSCWETIEGTGMGTAVVIDPARVIEMHELKSATPDASHALLITKPDANGKVIFYAGFGWEKAGVITTPARWQDYLTKFASMSL